MAKTRKAIVKLIYNTGDAVSFQDTLQAYLDESWEVESMNHTDSAFCVILCKDQGD